MSALGYTKHTLASAVTDSNTVTIAYPAGLVQADLSGTVGGEVVLNDGALGRWDQGDGVSFTFGGSTITVTNSTGVTWPVDTRLIASFGETAVNGSYNAATNSVSWSSITNKPSTFPPVIGTAADEAAAGDGSNPNYEPAT